MASWRPYLERTWELVRREPALIFFLVAAVWLPVAMRWVAAWLLGQQGALSVGEYASATGLLAVVIALASPAYGSGVMTLFRRSVSGERLTNGTFQSGLGRYYWRLAGGSLLLAIVALLLSLPGIATGAGAGGLQPGPLMGGAAAVVPFSNIGWVVLHPVLLLMWLAMFVIVFLVQFWEPAVALGEQGTFGAVGSSVRLVLRHWPVVLAAFVANALTGGALGAAMHAVNPAAGLGLGGPPTAATVVLAGQPGLGTLAAATLLAILMGFWRALYRGFLWVLYHDAGGDLAAKDDEAGTTAAGPSLRSGDGTPETP